MSNREIEFLLKMRDFATATWNKVKANIEAGSKSMASSFGKNWASIGAIAAGSIFLIGNALNRIDTLAKKVGKAVEGQLGGPVEEASKQLQEVSRYIEIIKTLADEALIRGGLFALGLGKTVAAFFAGLYKTIIIPIALIEKGLNHLGVTQSTYFQDLYANASKLTREYADDAANAFQAAFTSSKNLGLGVKAVADELESVTGEDIEWWKTLLFANAAPLKEVSAEVVKITGLLQTVDPGQNPFHQMLADIRTLEGETGEYFGAFVSGVGEVSSEVYRGFYGAFDRAFKGANSLLEKFVAEVLSSIARIGAEKLAWAIVDTIFAVATGGSFKPSSLTNSPTSIAKPSAGIIPPMGNSSFQGTPSRSSTLIYNNYAPITSEQALVKTLSNVVRDAGMSLDKVILNNRATTQLSS